MSSDDRVVNAFDYYRLHHDDSFEELRELHWRNAAAVIAEERQYQDVHCDLEQRIEILRLQVGRQERVYGPAWAQNFSTDWTHAGLERADKELEDARDRSRRLFADASTRVQNHRIGARIALQIIRERYPDREVGPNPYIGRASRF